MSRKSPYNWRAQWRDVAGGAARDIVAAGAARDITGGVAAKGRAFADDARGAMAISVGLFMALLLGMAVLALDVGRMVVLRTQLQNAADAAALAAANQLTGVTGARTLAEAVARNAALQTTNFVGGSTSLTIDTVTFFRNWTPGSPGTGDPATDDSNANVVRVTMISQTLALVLRPVLDVVTGKAGSDVHVQTASAVAEQAAVGCEMPPLMICNPFEDDSNPCNFEDNFYDSDMIGRQFRIKEGPGGVPQAPGQFGLLALPDGTSGAKALGIAISSPASPACYPLVTTAPGSKTNPIVWGINGRFGTMPNQAKNQGYVNDPAPHVNAFHRDSSFDDDIIGNGQWGSTARLTTIAADSGVAHPFTTGTTAQGVEYPTRYQIYLWQTGVAFQVNGPVTVYPVAPSGDLPSPLAGVAGAGGWTTINSGGTGPTSAASLVTGPDTILTLSAPNSDSMEERSPENSTLTGSEEVWVKRRNIRSAVLDCECLGVAGAGTYGPYGHYIDFFITEDTQQPGGGPGSQAAIHAEYQGAPLTGFGGVQDIVRNVRLVE